MSLRFIRAVAGCVFLLAAASAYGQATPAVNAANQEEVAEANFQRQMDQFQYSSRIHVNQDIPPDQRLLLDYGGYLSFSYLSVTDPTNNTHVLRDTDLVLYARANLDNVQEVFIRGKINYNDYNADHGGGPPDDFGGTIEGPGQHSDVEEAYYRFDVQRYLGAYDGILTHNDLDFELGRQTVIWGNGLVFNQNIDGGTLDAKEGPVNFSGVAGVTVPDTIDFDTSRPGFNDRTERGFFGALLGVQIDRHHPYAYFLSERDYNSNPPLTSVLGANTIHTKFDYNADYIGVGSTGSLTDRLAYGVEGTMELGNGESNSYVPSGGGFIQGPQHLEPIVASAADARLDYLFADTHNTRLSVEYIVASGDPNRTLTNTTYQGTAIGTTDTAFNGFGLLNTGLAFAPDISNVMVTRFGLSTQPLNQCEYFRKLELGTDIFVFNKTVEHAPIDEPTKGSGAEPETPGNSASYLGWEPDVFLNYQITSDLTLAIRYGVFFPGSDEFSGLSDKVRNLFYTGVTYAF
jgi:hypothetical protein